MGKAWKKGRGKLGFLQPLLGRWVAAAETPMGPVRCTRLFESILDGCYIQLQALWQFAGKDAIPPPPSPESPLLQSRGYQELALIGANAEGQVCFWSFTSDGKQSHGTVADVTDLHQEAIGFEAQMPAGLARMAYWPDDGDGFFWVVESRTKKGWRRFTEHHYRRQ